MHPFIALGLFTCLVLVVFFAIRYGMKLQFPNLGRISATLILAVGTLLDQLNALPWGQILSEAEAKSVGFAIAIGMAILHVYDTVTKQGA